MSSPKAAETLPFPSFTLGQWSALRLQLLWAYERTIPGGKIPLEGDFSFQSAVLVRRGWIEVDDRSGKPLRAKKGQWLLLPQGFRRQQWSQGCRLLSIGFRFQIPSGEPVFDAGLPLRVEGANAGALTAGGEEVIRIMADRVGLGYFPEGLEVALPDYLESQNVFGRFFVELARVLARRGVPPCDFDAGHAVVQRTLERLDGYRTSSHPTAKDLAREAGYSVAYLDRMLTAHTGLTMHRHLQERRLTRAKEVLRLENVSIKAVAYRLGFSSPAHFGAWFKQRTGQTPRAYRLAGSR
ncbi:MAG: helix-turn-helix transcriptional regulator [Terrimicrobiaceae bacterium]